MPHAHTCRQIGSYGCCRMHGNMVFYDGYVSVVYNSICLIISFCSLALARLLAGLLDRMFRSRSRFLSLPLRVVFMELSCECLFVYVCVFVFVSACVCECDCLCTIWVDMRMLMCLIFLLLICSPVFVSFLYRAE